MTVRSPGRRRTLHQRIYASIMLWLMKQNPLERVGSTTVIDTNLDPADDQPFFDTVREALALVQRLDPRRHRRIETFLHFIVNSELDALAVFDASLDACRLDFGKLRSLRKRFGQEWLVAEVATTLVHEATHALLHARGIAYDARYRRQAEALCVREEQRFVDRLNESLRRLYPLVFPFDERRWHWAWYGGRWARVKAYLARLRESQRDAESREGRPWIEEEQ